MNRTSIIRALLLALPVWLTGCGPSGSERAPAREAPRSEEHAESDASRIVLAAAQIDSAGIRLVSASAAKIRETLPLYGVITPNAERLREVTARYPGIVRSVNKRAGEAVREGETLVTVESNESLRTYPITAPLSGVITARKANPGEYSGEAVLFTVADLSTVWVELSLFPRDVAKVRVGQDVHVRSADSGSAAEGKVIYVAPFGEAANQTLSARVILNNAERRWAPGLYVTAEVTLAESLVPLAIRNDALQTLEERQVVFVKGAEGFEPRTITLGRTDSQFSEVLSGLKAGEVYAAAGSFILKAELGKSEAGHED